MHDWYLSLQSRPEAMIAWKPPLPPVLPGRLDGARIMEALEDWDDLREVDGDLAPLVFGHFASVWEATLDHFLADDCEWRA